MEPQQMATATTAVMTTAVTVSSILSAPAPAGGPPVAVVEVPDDDVPPPGWDQWVSLPTPAPEPPTVVLVMTEGGRVMPGCPAHGAEASPSRATLPASGDPAVHLEQKWERIGTSPAHFAEA
jgi:hypothetical protein